MIKKENIEFRYYEMPPGSVVLALLGEKWIGYYGNDSLHFHNYLEIGCCYYGEGHLVLGEKAYDYREHMISVIPRNYPHCTRSRKASVSRWEYLFVDVEGFLRDIYKDKPILQKMLLGRINQGPLLVNREEQKEINALVHFILDEMRDRKEMYQETVKGCLQALLIKIARLHEMSESLGNCSVQNVERLTSVLEYMNIHYQEPLRVKDMARISHMSETHFRRIFQEIMNTTPVEYLNLVRVQKACVLLEQTTKSVEEIGNLSGFTTPSTFNRNFKRIVGLPPAKWRDQSDHRTVNYRVSVYKGW